jgi:hypothetical protein
MIRISPGIFSNNKQLLFSETVCFFSNEGLELRIPIVINSQNREISFIFEFKDTPDGAYKINNSIDGDKITLELTNFCHAIGIGTTEHLNFSIGDSGLSMLFYSSAIKSGQPKGSLLNMTVSVYSLEGDCNV